MQPLRIAIVGTRGIPANYGGFETFAEELATRLAERGHEVRVYCRYRWTEPVWRGVRLAYLPTVRHKYLDTIAHTFLATLHLVAHRVDVALYCNGANAIFTPWPRLLGMPVALNVDGLERKRKKWNALARAWYLISEWLTTFCPSRVVTDAEQIAAYYRTRWGKSTTFIPYGAETGPAAANGTLERLGLEPGRYFLYVSRMEPENNALLVRQCFEQVNTELRLALIGDAPYAQDYIRQVSDTTDPRIVMPGAIYGQGYHELQSHSFAYIHATEVGGTHPALIEAMGRGAVVLFLDTPENAEVAGGIGLAFTPETLTARLREVLEMPQQDRAALGRRAADRVRERYSWEAVTDSYERLLREMRIQDKFPQVKTRPWLDLLAGVVAIVVVVGGCIAVHRIGSDFRGIYALTALAFFLAGVVRGKAFAGNLWWKAVRLSIGGLLGTAALIMNNGFHRLPVMLGLIPVAMAVSAAGVVARRDWLTARARSLGVAGTMAALAAIVILAVVPRMSESSAFEALDRPSPAFQMTVGDRSIGPTELRGRVSVLAFWASWCLPCIRELPELDRTYKRFANDSRVAFYAVDTGLLGNQTADDGRHFLERRRLSLPMAFDPGEASRALGVDALPTLLILDRNGHIRYVHHGYDGSEDMEGALANRIDQLLQ